MFKGPWSGIHTSEAAKANTSSVLTKAAPEGSGNVVAGKTAQAWLSLHEKRVGTGPSLTSSWTPKSNSLNSAQALALTHGPCDWELWAWSSQMPDTISVSKVQDLFCCLFHFLSFFLFAGSLIPTQTLIWDLLSWLHWNIPPTSQVMEKRDTDLPYLDFSDFYQRNNFLNSPIGINPVPTALSPLSRTDQGPILSKRHICLFQ